MRLRRRNFHATVRVQSGESPILVGFGWCTLEITIDEARGLAWDLANAIEQLHRGVGEC